jgi:putative heme-binding domain-containing protein
MPKKNPALAGGDWQKGKELFYGNEAKCSACHAVREQGGKLGPDLTRMVHLDPEGVLRDIVEPSASINPDFISYQIKLKNGLVLSGIARGEGIDKFRVLTVDSKEAKDSKETLISRDEIEKLVPSEKSVMPDDYKKVLGDAKLKDLLTFLCEEEPKK